jgi:hypothetical protein
LRHFCGKKYSVPLFYASVSAGRVFARFLHLSTGLSLPLLFCSLLIFTTFRIKKNPLKNTRSYVALKQAGIERRTAMQHFLLILAIVLQTLLSFSHLSFAARRAGEFSLRLCTLSPPECTHDCSSQQNRVDR